MQSLPAMNKALGSVSKYRRRDGPKFNIVKFIILFLKDRWLSNTSFFSFFHQNQLLRTRLFMAALFLQEKWDRGGGKSRKLPKCLSTEGTEHIGF